MKTILQNSIVLITSNKPDNKCFGTGFVIHNDKHGAYIITCAHVIKDVGTESVEAAGHSASVIALGDANKLDLAVLKVERLGNRHPLKVSTSVEIGEDFDTVGFQRRDKMYACLPLRGKIRKLGGLPNWGLAERIKAWKIEITDKDTLQPGYSGSPVVREDKRVCGVIVDMKEGGKEGLAISIEALEAIWDEIPQEIIRNEILPDESFEELDEGIKESPFDPGLFVNRKDEIETFLKVIRGESEKRYLEFSGIAGQGKTQLLKWIHHNATNKGYLSDYYSAYVDFESTEYHRSEIYPILKKIVDDLSTQISSNPFCSFKEYLAPYCEKLSEFYRNLSEGCQNVDRKSLKRLEDKVITSFNKCLNNILKSNKIVLCLDSTEKVSLLFSAFRDFEDQILKYHSRHQNFILVCAGQEELDWGTPEITNQIIRNELSCLKLNWVYEQVKSLSKKMGFKIGDDIESLIKESLQLTQGHPFSIYVLVDLWTKGFKSPLEKNRIEDQELLAQISQKLIKRVIEERVLENFQFNKNYPPVIEIIRYLAPLRYIELGTICSILPLFLENFKGKDFEFFEEMMNELKDYHLFMPSHIRFGVRLKSLIRNILLYDMRVKGNLFEVHKTLSDHYDNQIKQAAQFKQTAHLPQPISLDGEIISIVERLYHCAVYLTEAQLSNLDASIQGELEGYLQSYFTSEFTRSRLISHDQCERLSNILENDEELGTLVNIRALLDRIEYYKTYYN